MIYPIVIPPSLPETEIESSTITDTKITTTNLSTQARACAANPAPSSRFSMSLLLSYSSLKFVSIIFALIFLNTFYILFPLYDMNNVYMLQIHNILITILMFIFIPKYYINQNYNPKLYVSVYHWQPAPVLPWQLPDNFDDKSVKLKCIKSKN